MNFRSYFQAIYVNESLRKRFLFHALALGLSQLRQALSLLPNNVDNSSLAWWLNAYIE